MKIEYKFNIGDKLKVIYGGLFTDMFVGAIGVITDELSANGVMDLIKGFSLKMLEPEEFNGQVWRFSMLGEYELIETSNFEGCERLQYRDTKKYKTVVRNRLISFEKKDYIEEDKLNNTNVITLLGKDFEIREYNNELICIKDCMYPKGTIVDVVSKFDKYVVVAKDRHKDVFTHEELDKYFMEYMDISKVTFKVVDNGVVGLRSFYCE